MVLLEGVRPVLLGILGGVLVTILAGRSMDALVFGVRPVDLRVMGFIAGALTVAALAAHYRLHCALGVRIP